MSLQVWLPLNGDLHNQGLKQVKIINHNTTFDANGKIGQCCNIASGQYLGFDAANVNNNKYPHISLAAWIYPTQSDSTERHVICCYENGGAGINLKNTKFGGQIYVGGYKNCYTPSTITINTWYHVCMTYNGSKLCLYLNGELVNSTTASGPITYHNTCPWQIAGNPGATAFGNNDFIGKINDLRIYDHCLSQKEIKELSKALILHYPFKDNGTAAFNKNLLPDSNVNALTKMLGTQARYYEQTSATGYTATWITIADPPAPGIVYGLQLEKTSGTAFHAVTWYQSGTISVSAEPYTMSAYVKRISGTDLQLAFQYGKSPYAGTEVTIINDDEWHQYSWTFTPNTASGQAAASGNTRIYCGGLSSEVGTIQICGWKLEKGSTATPWNECGNVFYDCSGFGNNGMGIGSLTELTTAPRFGAGIKFDNTYKHIIIPNFPTQGFGDSYTFAWWGSRSAQNVMYWGFGNGIKLNGMYNGIYWNTGDGSENPLYKPGTTTAVTAPALNTWTHWVMTGDGEKCQVYQNGVLWGEAKTYKSISGNLLFINGWNNLNNYSSNNLSIADFRIYATALSAEDVKDLYESSASIDNFANAYGREIIETDDTLSINKQGQFIVNDIEESSSITTAALTKVDKKLKTNTLYEY